MFKTVSTTNEVRPFGTYAEAYAHAMKEGEKSRLVDIIAASADVVVMARAEKLAFHSSPRISIDGFPIWEIFNVHTGEVVDERDHKNRAQWRADDMTEESDFGHEFAIRLSAI